MSHRNLRAHRRDSMRRRHGQLEGKLLLSVVGRSLQRVMLFGGPDSQGKDASAKDQHGDCHLPHLRHECVLSLLGIRMLTSTAAKKNTPETANVQRMSLRVSRCVPDVTRVSRTGNTKTSTATSRKNVSRSPIIRTNESPIIIANSITIRL